jgi:hypothetical protein
MSLLKGKKYLSSISCDYALRCDYACDKKVGIKATLSPEAMHYWKFLV